MILIAFLLLLLSGCMNIRVETQVPNLDVESMAAYSDCVPIIMAMAWGEASIDGAKQSDYPVIDKVRTVHVHDYMIFYFGARCVEVSGSTKVKKTSAPVDGRVE